MWDPYSEFKSAALPNGLTIHVLHWPDRPWERVGFLIHSGAKEDKKGLHGTAHFVEHLVSEHAGTNVQAIKRFFQSSGGSVHLGSTSHVSTGYGFLLPTSTRILSKGLEFFGNGLLMARLEKGIERERNIISHEYRRKVGSDLGQRRILATRKALYAGTPFERLVLGNPESIAKISQKDLQAYYDTHYVPSNMSIVCVGGLSLDQVCNLFSKSPFGKMKKGKRNPLGIPYESVPKLKDNRFDVKISEHSSMVLSNSSYEATSIIPGNISYPAIRILNRMLNEMLYSEMRLKRHSTYDFSSSFQRYREFFVFEIESGSISHDMLDFVDEIIDKILEKVGNSKKLMRSLCNQEIARKRLHDADGESITGASVTELSIYGRIISLKEEIDQLQNLTTNDIHQALKWLGREYRFVATTRP